MKKTTPILVIFILVLSAMVWKVAENHNAIKLAKQQQNAHYTSPGLDRSHTQSIDTNESNTEPQIAHQQSLEIKNSTKPPISKVKRVLAIPGEPLEVGFEWTDAYYDPDQLEEPGYREKVMEHLHAKHYYESPQRQMPPFQQSLDLLEQWDVEPNLENTVILHDAAVEWHRNLYYAERESGPAAGPKAKERATFMAQFKKESIRGRFKDLFGIKDEAFMEAFVNIKPDRPILGPKLKIEPGQRLMKRTR